MGAALCLAAIAHAAHAANPAQEAQGSQAPTAPATPASQPAQEPLAQQFRSAEVARFAGGNLALPPARPDLDAQAAAWQPTPLPHVMERPLLTSTTVPDETVTTWLRLSLRGLPTTQGVPVLYVPRWQTIGKIAVYGDGRLLERSRGGAIWNGFNHPLWIPLAGAGERPPQEILVRIVSLRSAGGALSTVWVGDQRALEGRRFWRALVQVDVPAASSAAFLVLGFFAFGVWVLGTPAAAGDSARPAAGAAKRTKRRREPVFLLFFLCALLSYVRCLQYSVGQEPLPIAEDWFSWLTVSCSGWLLLAALALALRMNGRRYPRLEKTLAGLMLVATAITLPSRVVPDMASLAPLAYILLFVVALVMTAMMCVAAWRSGSRGGLLLAAWNLLVPPLIVHDWLLQNYHLSIEGVYLVPYTMLGTFVLCMALLLMRYTHAMRALDAANTTLESRLRQRESELLLSHEQLRQAERQQVLGDERQRLIRDMHDGFGSALIGALTVVEHSPPGSIDVAQVLRECIDDLKLTIDSLEPMDTDLLLLLASLRFRLGPRLEAAGVALLWEVDEELRLPWLSPGSALHILRMLQEVFSNVVKHAGATQVAVVATQQGSAITIAVEDNGRGFDATAMPQAGRRGLGHLRRRAEAIGAEVRWESRPGRTCVLLVLPASP